MSKQSVTTFYCQSRRWSDLANSIQEALFDAQHGLQGLQGASPSVQILISRELLELDGPRHIAALRALSAALELQGVRHSFHCAVAGMPEPKEHKVQITLA